MLWPAGAGATPIKADRNGNKIADDLEERIAPLSDEGRLRLIVSLSEAASGSRVADLEQAVGEVTVKQRFHVVKAIALTATKRQIKALARQGVVDRVEEDSRVEADAGGGPSIRNDSAQASFGVLEARLDAPLLDGSGDGDPATYSSGDLVAAVLDTGIDASHVDLDGGKVLAFKDFVNDRSSPYDDEGHGTHVAATIAGEGGGNALYRGVAPGAGLVGVKVLDAQGDGFTSDVVAAIQWVIENKDLYGIEAINLSLGSEGCGDGFGADSQAVNEAAAAGLVVAVAAGNEGPNNCTIGSPGDAKDAITVGAMADLGALGFKQADVSGRGPTADGRVKPDISAPGVSITAAAAGSGSGYATLSGTSMASPFVTGVALLMMDANGSYTNQDVKATIRSTAVDWGRGGTNSTAGTSGPDIDYGAGRLDAYRALAAADPTLTTPPSALPPHALREGSLAGTGDALEYTVDVADTTMPVAATLIDLPTACRGSVSNPDFDLKLIAPGGAVVATATEAERQDELGYAPPSPGVYLLRVHSFSDCGDFFVDVSGGAVSAEGTSNPDPPPATGGDAGGTDSQPPATPSSPPPPDTVVASAALTDAARTTARRATAALRRTGLRRLLRRRSFSVVGLTPTAGRVEVAVRMTVRGRRVLMARTIRQVTAAGQPKLTVRLTRAGRRNLDRLGLARLSIRAVISDGTGRRRWAERAVSVRR